MITVSNRNLNIFKLWFWIAWKLVQKLQRRSYFYADDLLILPERSLSIYTSYITKTNRKVFIKCMQIYIQNKAFYSI